ncbi:glycosyltransferase [Marixanthomonas spongiae]|uniref:Glycosyl transferase family 1 domain-containing protein n=1 Tax=Marixanthomonas spongiae TaxID=2174845 RepID=A0A2U0I5V3_9FLAO|nr:glycosyltransferase [Marixanthomonas spongiae]PVW16472.1 hypothetical protein DDV96_04240 [Marixanthomonas spongiae]
MPKHLSTHTSLLVVSDTAMCQKDSEILAFEPVVRELEAMLALFAHITWIGFNQPDKLGRVPFKALPSKRIRPILLDTVGGPRSKDKMAILKNYPKMYAVIHNEIKKHPVVHSRAPSNPAYIAMWLSKNYPNKRFWFKYAGNWTEPAPFFYRLQRHKLKTLGDNSVVTVNGQWEQQPNNVIAFDNPCLDENDREAGKKCVDDKTLGQEINYCFVGGLNENKGIFLLLEAFSTLKTAGFKGLLHIIGDGPLWEQVQEKVEALSTNIILHGSLPREEVYALYKKCHFLILPSKSEGFPKVISEAMNFGCMPIVSNVSCVDQYIADGENGFLIDPLSVAQLQQCLVKTQTMTETAFKKAIVYNYRMAARFTYSHYNEQIQRKILTNKELPPSR